MGIRQKLKIKLYVIQYPLTGIYQKNIIQKFYRRQEIKERGAPLRLLKEICIDKLDAIGMRLLGDKSRETVHNLENKDDPQELKQTISQVSQEVTCLHLVENL